MLPMLLQTPSVLENETYQPEMFQPAFHFYPSGTNGKKECVRPIWERFYCAGAMHATPRCLQRNAPAVLRPGRCRSRRPAMPARHFLPISPSSIPIYEEHFGAPLIPEGHLALLNKVPDKDRMEEIVVGGGIAGIIRYFPDTRKWEPVPRPEACNLFTPTKRVVVIGDDAVPFIRDQGMSVLRPGMVSIDDSVQAGDEVFILTQDGTCIGVGRAKVDAATARAMEKGSIVRTRRNIASQVVPGRATWDDAVRANADVLERAEGSSILFVQEVADATRISWPMSPTPAARTALPPCWS